MPPPVTAGHRVVKLHEPEQGIDGCGGILHSIAGQSNEIMKCGFSLVIA